jgi:hypothetical protein
VVRNRGGGLRRACWRESSPLPPARPGEARLADVEKFFQPATGILWQYFTESLQADIERVGSIFRVKEGASVRYKDDFLKFWSRAQDMSSRLFAKDPGKLGMPIEVRIHPSAQYSKIVFDTGGTKVVGLNAVERWDEILWPSRRALVRLYVKSDEVESLGPREDSDWALFHLLGQGGSASRNGDVLSLSFVTHARPGEGADRLQARCAARPVCALRASTQHHPRGCRVSQVVPAARCSGTFFGKIPAERDFVRVNAGAFLRAGLDRWFQEGVEQLQRERTHLPAEPAHFLLSPAAGARLSSGFCARRGCPWPRLPSNRFRGAGFAAGGVRTFLFFPAARILLRGECPIGYRRARACHGQLAAEIDALASDFGRLSRPGHQRALAPVELL